MDTHDLTVLRSAAKNRLMPWGIKELGWRVIGMCLIVMIATSMPSSGACQSLSDEADTESIEYPGEPTDWHGFRQYRFSVDEIPVIDPGADRVQRVTDLLAGMTDRYCIANYTAIYVPEGSRF